MSCFEGYIGVGTHCLTNESVSGKYLTDLPGVSLQNIDSVANENQLSFLGVFADVEKRAISRISKDVLSYMKSQYNLKKVNQTVTSPDFVDGSQSSLNNKNGIKVYSICDNSELLRLYVGRVWLYALEEKETTITIESESVLYTNTIVTNIGWNEIYINKVFDTLNLNILYTDANFTQIPNLILGNSCICNVCDCDLTIRGISGNSIGNNTYGLRAEVGLRCIYDAIVCANLDVYSDAYLYALGVELMRERLYSDTINRFTTVDRKKAQELLELFTQDYTDFLQTANNSIHIKDDFCIECLETMGSKFLYP